MVAAAALICSGLSAGCGGIHRKSLDELAQDSSTQPPPVRVERPITQSLASFGKLIRVYTGFTDPMIVEVDFIANDSGLSEELPSDLGYYAVKAVSSIGEPFHTTRAYTTIAIHGTGAAYGLGEKSQVEPVIKLKGLLLRASSRVETEGGVSAKLGVAIGHGGGTIRAARDSGGNNKLGVGGTVSGANKLTGLRVGFFLTTPEGITIPGPTAEYEVLSRTEEGEYDVSISFGDSELGGGKTVKVSHDAGNAISDATAACVMQLLGHWLMVPYYRCDPSMKDDENLKERLYSTLSKQPQPRIELMLKGFMQNLGMEMDDGATVTDHDRRLLATAMSSALQLEMTRENLVKYYIHLWETADFEAAAVHVDQNQAALARAETEWLQRQVAAAQMEAVQEAAQAEAEAVAAAEETELVAQAAAGVLASPEDFGWPAGTTFVVVDSATIPDHAQRLLLF